MTAPVELFVENGWVYITDANGPGDIPVRVIHVLSETANRCDDGRGWWNGRAYDRDVLNSARELLDNRETCTYSDRWVSCDEPADRDANGQWMTDLHDRIVCPAHAPDDNPTED